MSTQSNLRGILFMSLATGSYVINDTFMKLATEGLPAFETLFLRGVMATLWCLPLVLLTGNGPRIPSVFNGWTLLRNSFELLARAVFHRGAEEHADRRHHGAGTDCADAAADRRGAGLR